MQQTWFNSGVRNIHWRRDRLPVFLGFPCGSAGKESACSEGDLDLIPRLGRSPGEGKGYPLQYSGLENSMDCIVQGVAKSQTWLSDFHFHFRPGGSVVKNLPATAGDSRDRGSIPGSGRYPGEGNGYPLQYSGLENYMDCIVHGVTNSRTRLSNFHFHSASQVCVLTCFSCVQLFATL